MQQPRQKCQALCAGSISLAEALEELSRGQDASAALARRALEACARVSRAHSADAAAASKCSLTGLPGSICPAMPLVELSGCLFWVSLVAASGACVCKYVRRSELALIMWTRFACADNSRMRDSWLTGTEFYIIRMPIAGLLLTWRSSQQSHGRWCCAGSCCKPVPQALLIPNRSSAFSLRRSSASRMEIYSHLASLKTGARAFEVERVSTRLEAIVKALQSGPCLQSRPSNQTLIDVLFNSDNAQGFRMGNA